jgi:sn-glycerol 3-phosphate transport system substrate-binding protein
MAASGRPPGDALSRALQRWQATGMRTFHGVLHHCSRASRAVLAPFALAGLLVATGGAGVALPAGVAAAAGQRLAPCPLSALRSAKGTVDIDFWESMNQANGTTLQTLTNQFNASQKKVHVTLVSQADYTTTWIKYQAGLNNGQLPDLVQLTETGLQGAVDSRSILPVQSCINASHYPTSDFVPRTLAWYKIGNVQEGMPFAVSIPIVYYNKQSFSAAGLNPNDPPKTLSQYVADAQVLKAHGSGTGLVVDPWHFRNWLATANQLSMNHDNGRSGRATKAVFDSKAGLQIWSDLDEMVKAGAASTNPAVGPDAYDNLLGIGTGKYGMTIDTSAALGTVTSLVKQYPNVTLGVGPFPVLSTRIHGGVSGGGSALYISDKVPAAQQAAAWEYTTFLDSTQSQATWAAGTGYIPIRKSSVKTPTITQLWAANPGFEVAYSQLTTGPVTAATSGEVVGPYLTITTALVDAENSMFDHGVSPASALQAATQQVDSVLSSYNQRIGTT